MQELMGADRLEEYIEKYALYRIDIQWVSTHITLNGKCLLQENNYSENFMKGQPDTTFDEWGLV